MIASGRRRGKMMAEINITPLTDVALVLLIIFMVTTPFIVQGGLAVKLPNAAARPTEPDALTITLTRDGTLALGPDRVSRETLPQMLRAQARRGDRMVVIKADAAVPHGDVVGVLDQVREAGFTRLAIATQPQGVRVGAGLAPARRSK
mgnify:CR=1 FL=1